jgi:hypothetical protein
MPCCRENLRAEDVRGPRPLQIPLSVLILRLPLSSFFAIGGRRKAEPAALFLYARQMRLLLNDCGIGRVALDRVTGLKIETQYLPFGGDRIRYAAPSGWCP